MAEMKWRKTAQPISNMVIIGQLESFKKQEVPTVITFINNDIIYLMTKNTCDEFDRNLLLHSPFMDVWQLVEIEK